MTAVGLTDPAEQRWPAVSTELPSHGRHAAVALPVRLIPVPVRAPDLVRARSGVLSPPAATGAPHR